MDIEVGQIWRIVGLSEKSVVEVTSITGNVVFFEYDGEKTRIKDWLTVSRFLEFHEFVRNKGDTQVIYRTDMEAAGKSFLDCMSKLAGTMPKAEGKNEEESGEDMVNKPPHYKDASGIECKEITCHRKMPFSLGNAIKYLYRAGSKGDLLEDLKKAEWYLRVAYLNGERVPKAVEVRLLEVAAHRKTAAGRALNAIRLHEVAAAYQSVKSEIERLEAGSD